MKKYNIKEISTIRLYYPRCPKERMLSLLPKRDWSSIQNKAYQLSVKREIKTFPPFTNVHKTNIKKARLKFLKDNPDWSPWCKGLTKDIDKRLMARSLRMKKELAENPSLNWMFGKKHRKSSREKMAKTRRVLYEKRGTKHHYKHDYFSNLTPDSAYLLGFIAADGSIVEDKKNNNKIYKRVVIRLAETEPLEIIKSELETSSPIHKYLNKHSFKPNSVVYQLNIFNQRIVRDLESYGITPRKTFTLEYPKINNKLDKHFIRGILDGDGWLLIAQGDCTRKYLHIGFSSASEKFIMELKNKLDVLSDANGYLTKTRKTFQLRYTANKAYIIVSWLYENANLYLNRKKKIWNTYNEYLRTRDW